MLIAVTLLLQTARTAAPATFQNPRLVESSGVAVSRAHPGVLWTHNDSGDGPFLYATDLQGRDRGSLLVPGAHAVDWEDIALGPCPSAAGSAGACVYIADTGDNSEDRRSVTVYAVPEPIPPEGPADTLRATSAPAVLRLRYPDGSHDVEAIYVAPRDTALFLVSKGRGGPIRLYRVDRGSWAVASNRAQITVATRVQALDILPNSAAGRLVTAAAIRPDGRLVAIRTYTEIYLFRPGVGGRLIFASDRPCNIAGLGVGGEAIDFLDDSTFVLTSEATARHAGTIQAVKCVPRGRSPGNDD